MKFDGHDYWKHDNCTDVFISVNSVAFDDDGRNAVLWVTWCTQGIFNWWFTVTGRIIIRPEHYDRWKRYEPKGDPKL